MSRKPKSRPILNIGTPEARATAELADRLHGPMSCECRDKRRHKLGCSDIGVRIDAVFICPECWDHAPILRQHGLGPEQLNIKLGERLS